MRVRIRWRAERVGDITDIECFEPLPRRGETDGHREVRETVDPVTGIVVPIELDYLYAASPEESLFYTSLAEGKLVGQRCPTCEKVYIPPRSACPADGTPTAEEVELPDTGTVTTFCIVNVPFLGQRITPPYVSAYVLLDGADIALPAPDPRHPGRRGPDGHAGQGGLEAPRRVGHHDREHQPLRADRRAGRGLRHLQAAPLRGRTDVRDVAVVGFAQRQMKEFDGSPTCVELLVPLFAECYEQTGWTRKDVGFWCSGSSDYLAGRSFSFVQAVDAIGVIPPVNESHVEMDLAWAMYEAWLKIQTGEVDTALVYAFGKSSAGVLRRTLALQLEPYTMTPLWPDTVSLAGLQARAGIDAGLWDERAMAEVANRSLTDAEKNEYAIRKGGSSVEELLARPMYADPLRKHDCAPVTDGAAALVLAAGDRAREVRERPAWITGLSPLRRPDEHGHPRPDPLPLAPSAPGRRSTSTASRWPSCTRRSATRS